jgi:hypothetical protein
MSTKRHGGLPTAQGQAYHRRRSRGPIIWGCPFRNIAGQDGRETL